MIINITSRPKIMANKNLTSLQNAKKQNAEECGDHPNCRSTNVVPVRKSLAVSAVILQSIRYYITLLKSTESTYKAQGLMPYTRVVLCEDD